MRTLILFCITLVVGGCAVVEPTPENGCDPSGVQASHNEANALAALSLASFAAGGSNHSGLSAHATTADQQAEIIKLKVELCEQQLEKLNQPE